MPSSDISSTVRPNRCSAIGDIIRCLNQVFTSLTNIKVQTLLDKQTVSKKMKKGTSNSTNKSTRTDTNEVKLHSYFLGRSNNSIWYNIV